MKLGYTVWTWMKGEFADVWTPTKDAQRLFENAAKDISYLGYKYIENFSFVIPIYENNKEALDKLLDETGLTFTCIYLELSGDETRDLDNAKRCCKFMKENNIKHLNIEAPHVPLDGPVTKNLLDEFCSELEKISSITEEHGVVACLHQHTRTLCETQRQLDYIMANTDKDKIRLCLDTCHIELAGMDPLTVYKQYFDRLSYVHLKDVVADYKRPYISSVTENARPLGEGIVNFKEVIDFLDENNYDGVFTVEVDYPEPDSFGAARTSIDYLKDLYPDKF